MAGRSRRTFGSASPNEHRAGIANIVDAGSRFLASQREMLGRVNVGNRHRLVEVRAADRANGRELAIQFFRLSLDRLGDGDDQCCAGTDQNDLGVAIVLRLAEEVGGDGRCVAFVA